MLRFKSRDGTRFYGDLLEMCEEAAGANAGTDAVIAQLAGVLHRLVELHPDDEQTALLQPLDDLVHPLTEITKRLPKGQRTRENIDEQFDTLQKYLGWYLASRPTTEQTKALGPVLAATDLEIDPQ